MVSHKVNNIIEVAVGLIIAGSFLPTAISTLLSANKTGWDAGTTAIYGVIGIVGILAVALGFINMVTSE